MPPWGRPPGLTVGNALTDQRVFPCLWMSSTEQQVKNLFKTTTMDCMQQLERTPRRSVQLRLAE
eukprot:1613346-Prorocentrum_lima.AAC.1